LTRVNAWSNIDGLVDVAELKVPEGDISHTALTRICLDPCCVGGVVAFEILEQDVIDVVGAVSITERANDGTS